MSKQKNLNPGPMTRSRAKNQSLMDSLDQELTEAARRYETSNSQEPKRKVTVTSLSCASNKTYIKNFKKGVAMQKAKKFRFFRGKGVRISNEDRHWILRIYYWFKSQRLFDDVEDVTVRNLVADIACCAETAVKAIVDADEYETADRRGHAKLRKLEVDKEEEVKKLVKDKLCYHLENGEPIFSKDIRKWFEEATNVEFTKNTVLNYCKAWGLQWKRLKVDEYRKERNYVITQREIFLQEINEELKKPEKQCEHIEPCECPRRRNLVFLDESYVHQNHVSNYGWTLEDAPIRKPSGKGKKIVIAGAFTNEGWLGIDSSEQYVFKADENCNYSVKSIKYWIAKIGGNYHKNFDSKSFELYFKENVLKNLTNSSIIIMDRATYHVCFNENQFFPGRAKKSELRKWLDEKKINYNENALKADLKVLALANWECPKMKIEKLAEEDGLRRFKYSHKVMFLPPYHPEYNAIENAWGRIKNILGANPTYNLEEICNRSLPNAILSIPKTTAKKMVDHVINQWREDIKKDADQLEIAHRIKENKHFNDC